MVTVLAGHLLYNSQGSRAQSGLQPVLAGHLSITATFSGPEGDHYRQVPLYIQYLGSWLSRSTLCYLSVLGHNPLLSPGHRNSPAEPPETTQAAA